MKRSTLLMSFCACMIATGLIFSQAAQSQQVRIFNTVKQKLADGGRVVGVTVATADPEIYCAVANAGFDFVWIEMQHSPLTFADSAPGVGPSRSP